MARNNRQLCLLELLDVQPPMAMEPPLVVKHGRWTVVADAGRDRWNVLMVRCVCVCGTEAVRALKDLRAGRTRSCKSCAARRSGLARAAMGIFPPSLPRRDLVGLRFGLWTVIGDAPDRAKHRMVLCRCDCGVERVVATHSLEGAATRGCLVCRNSASYGAEYGEKQPRREKRSKEVANLDNRLIDCRRRCNRKQDKDYASYGGRGIRFDFVSIRAASDYIVETMGLPGPGQSLDRIDNDGPYGPGNLRWASMKQQQANRRPQSRWNRDWAKVVADVPLEVLLVELQRRGGAGGKSDGE